MIYSSKSLSYCIIFFVNFLTGVEYGVIIPSALQYLREYGGNQVDLGLCVSAYSFSSLFSSPIMGKLSDKTRNTKAIILVANLFQIGGSFMYFMGISKNFIIGGRLVSGIGLGCLGCLFSDIVKTTQVSERSKRLSKIMVGRQIGLIMGPAFNLITVSFDYKIGPFKLDSLSAPGLLMTVAWIFLQIIIIFFYKNLNDFNDDDDALVSDEATERTGLLASNNGDNSINENDGSSNTYNIDIQVPKSPRSYQSSIRIVDNSETGNFYVLLYKEYIRDEVIVVIFTAFTVIFIQTSIETFLTPFTKDYYGWNETGNSILYSVCGVEIMLVFVMLTLITSKISDRLLMVIGLLGNLSTLLFLTIWLPNAVPSHRIKDILLFAIPAFIQVFSLPLIVLPTISLLSKVTSIKNQGFTQGLRSVFVGIAQILGPNWAGSTYKNWYLFLGVMLALILTSLIMALFSYPKLKGDTQTKTEESIDNSLNNTDD